MSRYAELSHFYLADPRRLASRERDVGLIWRDGGSGPLYRAAWIRDTGELYVVRLGPAAQRGGEVEVLGIASDRNQLETALAGWRDVCPEPDSMSWLRDHAGRLPRTAGEPGPAPAVADRGRERRIRLAAILSALIVGVTPTAATARTHRVSPHPLPQPPRSAPNDRPG